MPGAWELPSAHRPVTLEPHMWQAYDKQRGWDDKIQEPLVSWSPEHPSSQFPWPHLT